jgi:hypothetical protein
VPGQLRAPVLLIPIDKASQQWPFAGAPLQGVKGLDVLFLLCGFFATVTLVPALEGASGSLTQASAAQLGLRKDISQV